MFVDDVWQWIKNAWPTIVVISVAAWGYFEFVGKKWVEHRFSRDLEAFKGEQQKELEAYKSQQQEELERLLHRLSSRISKIHEKEFKVLPQAWLMLNDLRGAVQRALDLTMKPYPGFRNFSQAKLEEFLKSEPVNWLTEYQKEELRKASSSEKQERYYMDALQSHYLDEAHNKHQKFLNYLIEHQIFMTDELREKFYGAERALFSALTSYSIGKGNDHELVRSGQEEMLTNMQARIDEVDKAVQKRLRYEEA
jgi:hypothetical protein